VIILDDDDGNNAAEPKDMVGGQNPLAVLVSNLGKTNESLQQEVANRNYAFDIQKKNLEVVEAQNVQLQRENDAQKDKISAITNRQTKLERCFRNIGRDNEDLRQHKMELSQRLEKAKQDLRDVKEDLRSIRSIQEENLRLKDLAKRSNQAAEEAISSKKKSCERN
jgi:argonaute-like protein implicated in RNA metabolism and viral defense